MGADRATRSRGTSSSCRSAAGKPKFTPSTAGPLTVKDGADDATISGKDFSVRIDKKAGVITSIATRA